MSRLLGRQVVAVGAEFARTEEHLREHVAALEAAAATAAAAASSGHEDDLRREEVAMLRQELEALQRTFADGGGGAELHAELRAALEAGTVREERLEEANAALRAELAALRAAAADGSGVVAQLGDAREKARQALDEFEAYRLAQVLACSGHWAGAGGPA